ncbi:MAG: hypothetical protein KIT40_10555 [Nitrospira sp.]|nr:hypothetical protein [Nitrospira sp.]
MTRSIVWFFLAGIVLFTAGCAESLHQGARREAWSSRSNAGYADGPAYGGAGYWWNPFGYYGPGYGWYGGGYGGTHQSSNTPAPRPTPPDNAPPQFQKKY